MQNILHRGAKTTPKIRKEIYDSTKSLMVLAQRYNLNFKTILKWNHREDFSDKPSGAIKPKSVSSDQEQAVICEFRRITQLPLDDVFVELKDKIPTLTRSNLYLCLKRFGYQKLPKDSILKKERQSFKTYELGFIHLDIASLHTAEGKAQGDQSTIIECGYDYMGRRYTKKVTINGVPSLQQRYIYRGYLQIACVDLTRSGHPALWYITWDPTEPVATRPLAIQKNATWYTYSHDLTKNVTELYQSDGLIATTYDYSPYGAATSEGIDQPLQWSSEYHDPELALTYYNYRHYNPTDGRWLTRDPIQEEDGFNLYGFVRNNTTLKIDYLGESMEDIVHMGNKTIISTNVLSNQEKVRVLDAVTLTSYEVILNAVDTWLIRQCSNETQDTQGQEKCNTCCGLLFSAQLAKTLVDASKDIIVVSQLRNPYLIIAGMILVFTIKAYGLFNADELQKKCNAGCEPCQEKNS